MNEIKKALYRMAATSAEREPLTTIKGLITSILVFFGPVLFILVLAIADFWMNVSPILYIIFAIAAGRIYYETFLLGQIAGQVRGAKYALQNPRNGETWIDIIDEGELIWTSEKFIPAPALHEPFEISTAIRLPKNYDTWVRWQRVYSFTRSLRVQKELREKEILAKLQSDLPDEGAITDRTLRDIEKAGREGYLDSWEKFAKMTGRIK